MGSFQNLAQTQRMHLQAEMEIKTMWNKLFYTLNPAWFEVFLKKIGNYENNHIDKMRWCKAHAPNKHLNALS